jgi:23S rRNA-/tRNA-specific pseudouridylate synthase
MSLLLLAVLALTGCGQNTPVTAYKAFHAQVQKRDYKKAYAALSQPTQEAIARQAETVVQASGGAVKAEPYELFFSNSALPPDITEATLLREEGDKATVRVLFTGQTREVRLVREGSEWKIDLSDSIKP